MLTEIDNSIGSLQSYKRVEIATSSPESDKENDGPTPAKVVSYIECRFWFLYDWLCHPLSLVNMIHFYISNIIEISICDACQGNQHQHHVLLYHTREGSACIR